MESKEVRKKFINFFKEKKHKIVQSAPMVLKDDPALMFTNAGMNQFKDYFLGNKVPESRRIADTQKCLRVSGKHNDLEDVGMDTYHHTMFEMLGNWSFGDYFKKEAIEWAWELLTSVYGLSKDRLYATVFEGDASQGVNFDQEAFDYWKQFLPEERILSGDATDNFWEMGDQGPCGPCSEIHIDLRDDKERKEKAGKDLVNADHPQVIEVWNLVFIQYNRKADKSLEMLPEKHIDTGMGFERLVRIIQNKPSNYDTDVFQPLIQFIEKEAGIKYGDNEKTDIAIRVLSDHIRAISFAISDGQLPSNNKAGYVIRRILRRAVRYGYNFLNFKEPFIYRMVPILSEQFEDVFPELPSQSNFIQNVIKEEEQSFLKTLDIGLKRLSSYMHSKTDKEIDGATAFELYDTYGFPLDLTDLIARENGYTVDHNGFQIEMEKQKARSKNAAEKETSDWVNLKTIDHVEFAGYDQWACYSHIARYRTVKTKNKKQYQIVLEKTPFYPEGGGQVGDTGYIQSGEEKINVTDTIKENELIISYVDKLPSNPEAEFYCMVDVDRRLSIMNNHTATHLLHAALREVAGSHVEQKGSLVAPDFLRFDFSHFSKLSDEELEKVEHIVNRKIRENIQKEEYRNIPFQDALEMGAMALFGEKYGDHVRVIRFDPGFSTELCGGTHVYATGNIGLFKIISESSISAGVRRIEAVTGEKAEEYVQQQFELVNEIKSLLKNPKDVTKTLSSMIEEKSKLQKTIEKLEKDQVKQIRERLLNEVEEVNGVNYIISKVELNSADALKKLVHELKNQVNNLVAIVAADIQGKPQIAVVISDHLVKEQGLNASNIVKDLSQQIKGGGGGQPSFATAGGKDINGIDKVIEKAQEYKGVQKFD